MLPAFRNRDDAWAKASGATRYVGDLSLPGMLHVALVRSLVPHARIAGIDTAQAAAADGVVGVFTAARTSTRRPTAGRCVMCPSWPGTRSASPASGWPPWWRSRGAQPRRRRPWSTLPTTSCRRSCRRRTRSPRAPRPSMTSRGATRALSFRPSDGHNLQSRVRARLALTPPRPRWPPLTTSSTRPTPPRRGIRATWSRRPASPWWTGPGTDLGDQQVALPARSQLAECLGWTRVIDIQPGPLGGDFGGKGSPMDIPLCVELARLTGGPVKLVLRYSEGPDRHEPAAPVPDPGAGRLRQQRPADRRSVWALLDGGAYAGFKPLPTVSLHGIEDCTWPMTCRPCTPSP